ncbi:unnamed protein product [Boreogadus saida]
MPFGKGSAVFLWHETSRGKSTGQALWEKNCKQIVSRGMRGTLDGAGAVGVVIGLPSKRQGGARCGPCCSALTAQPPLSDVCEDMTRPPVSVGEPAVGGVAEEDSSLVPSDK